MTILISIIFVLLGLFLLVKGADWFVDGASGLAHRFNVPHMVVGLTVVALGTSLPELMVSVQAAIQGSPSLTLSNIIGSNIANILLILGVAAIINPLIIHSRTVFKEIPFALLAAVVLFVLALAPVINGAGTLSSNPQDIVGVLQLSDGIIFLSICIIFLYYNFSLIKAGSNAHQDIDLMSIKKIVLLIIIGIVSLAIGSTLTVDNAIILATELGLSEALIGITLVAIGTSFPELVTSIVASRKKQGDIVLGNVIGSNILNIFFILGLSASIVDLHVSSLLVFDLVILIFSNIILLITIFLFKLYSIRKIEGVILVLCYILYTVFVVLRDIIM